MIQATLPISRLGIASTDLHIPDDGSLLLFDRRGHAISGLKGDPGRSFEDVPAIARALAGGAGAGEIRVPGREGTRLAAYAPVPGPGWAVVAERPRSAASLPLLGLAAPVAGTAVLVAAAAFGGALLARRLQGELDRERTRLAAILSGMADGVITVDAEGRIDSINPAMARLAGWSEEEVRGRHHSELYGPRDARGRPFPSERDPLARAIVAREAAASRGFEAALLRRDGRQVPVSIAAAPVIGDRGGLTGGVAVLRDISHEREVDQMKSSLISTVSHELRTPLTMIQGFAELLGTRDLGERKARQAIEQIGASAQRLSRLIDDLLSVSRIESGRIGVKACSLDLPAILGEVVPSFARDREVVLDVPEGLPSVLADRDKVEQVLTNLLSNAVKYSPPGAPVSVTARPSGPAVEISVADRGIGMSEEEVDQLFEKFFRADRPEVRRAGGTGLGLYISRSLVELQGGTISVKSKPGEGSVFSFTLPLARSPKEAPC